MRYRKLDKDGDYVFGSGSSDFLVNSPEAVAQAVLTRLQLWLGEWFADTSDGTGWKQAVLGRQPENMYEMAIQQRVLETQGVSSIESFESDLNRNTRRLTITMTINTIYGITEINRELTAWN
jgi:hypothetical protein